MKRVSFSRDQHMTAFRRVALISIVFFFSFSSLYADLLTYNSLNFSDNGTTRALWLAGCGISTPDFLIDFETGFDEGDDVSGVPGLFPSGLIITDVSESGADEAIIVSGSGSINNSNPVGIYSLTQAGVGYLLLDFSANPISYLAFLAIDHAGITGTVTYVGGSTGGFSVNGTEASGDSAEFFGLYCNDMPRIREVQLDVVGYGIWGIDNIEYGVVVPIPTAIWLFGSGLIGLLGIRRRMKNQSFFL